MTIIPFFELSLLIALAALLGLFANKFKQPPLLGYILAGALISFLGIFSEDSAKNFELFSKIGITFLLFILGLELNLGDLKKLGAVSLVTGIGQIIFTTVAGTLIAMALGFSPLISIYIAIALTFSSTIVIVKLLQSKRELHTLYGKISIGFLIVQDVVAMLILMTIVTLGSSATGVNEGTLSLIGGLLIKIPALFLALWGITKYVLPWLIKQSGHDREVLFLVMIGWALFFSAVVAAPPFNFTVEIGALLAGIALSSRKEHLQIESWTRSLKDFFLTVFFVLLGLNLNIDSFGEIIIPSLIFSFFVLIGNPLIVMIIMGALGYNKRVGFFTSLTVAQISEFSLLVASLGFSFGHISQNELSILTLVGGITMSVSSYLIYYNYKVYDLLKPVLGIFEFRKHKKRGSYKKGISDHVVLFGFHKLAESTFQQVFDNKESFLIVEHNPVIVDNLKQKGINVIYGDMNDIDLYEHLNLETARLVISTVPNKVANMKLINYLETADLNIPTVVTAASDSNADFFYEHGADYVIYPHLLAGIKLNSLIESEGDINDKLSRLARKESKILDKRLDLSIK